MKVAILSSTTAEPSTRSVRILDLCTGTGCIALLLSHFLGWQPQYQFRTLGIDISSCAISLARQNLALINHHEWGGPLLPNQLKPIVKFARADVMSTAPSMGAGHGSKARSFEILLANRGHETFDILVSNPPYISPRAFRNGTPSRSVRLFEPKEALVPLPSPSGHASGIAEGDQFYPRILQIAGNVGAKVVLMEVGDEAQALRVAQLVLESDGWEGTEVWHDGVENSEWSGEISDESRTMLVNGKPRELRIIGRNASDKQGPREGRAVLCWRGEGAHWLDKRS